MNDGLAQALVGIKPSTVASQRGIWDRTLATLDSLCLMHGLDGDAVRRSQWRTCADSQRGPTAETLERFKPGNPRGLGEYRIAASHRWLQERLVESRDWPAAPTQYLNLFNAHDELGERFIAHPHRTLGAIR